MKVLNRAIVMLLAITMTIGILPQMGAMAAEKPGTPVITLKAVNNGGDVKVSINATSGTDGYKIVMKAPRSTKYEKVKILKKDGTTKRTYTVTGLSAGKYSFRVKAYSKIGSKTVWGNYSKTKSITVKQALGLNVTDFLKANTGDYIIFGSYEQDNDLTNGMEPIEWLVLSNNGEEMYVLSKYALDVRPYNEPEDDEGLTYGYVTWETCALRKWLNDEFYNTAFNTVERAKIKTTIVKNDDNPVYGVSMDWNHGGEGGNDTEDKVFLPSIADMVNTDYGFVGKYDADNEKQINRRCAATSYAVQSVWMNEENKEWIVSEYETTEEEQPACCWWLRSPGFGEFDVATVYGYGAVNYDGSFNGDSWGVRPTMILNLK